MTELQKAQLAVSEARAALLALPDEAGAEDIEPREKALKDAEARHRRAILLADEGERKGEEERAPLAARVEVREYLSEALGGQPAQGASRELREELKLDAGTIPWAALLPRGGEGGAEKRADVATQAPSTVGMMQQSVVARVFSRSVSRFLGVEMPTVGVGEQAYPILSGGAAAEVKAKGAGKDATAATFTVVTATPKRATARYVFRVEDVARFQMLEDALRADLRIAIQDKLDDIVVNGTGTAPEPRGLLVRLDDPTPAPAAVVTAAELIGAQAGSVDGKFAANLMDTRQVLGVASFGKAATLSAWGDGSNGSAADYLAARSGGLLTTARIPAPDASTKVQSAIVHLIGGVNRAHMPIWEGLRIIRDEVTKAEAGEIAITALALMDFIVTDVTPWKQVDYKTAA